jgi:hypothetical protein
MPLVYATKRALAEAARLLPAGVCLENECEQLILDGHVISGQSGGLIFDRDKHWIARATRRPGRLRERPRAWLITQVDPYNGRRR